MGGGCYSRPIQSVKYNRPSLGSLTLVSRLGPSVGNVTSTAEPGELLTTSLMLSDGGASFTTSRNAALVLGVAVGVRDQRIFVIEPAAQLVGCARKRRALHRLRQLLTRDTHPVETNAPVARYRAQSGGCRAGLRIVDPSVEPAGRRFVIISRRAASRRAAAWTCEPDHFRLRRGAPHTISRSVQAAGLRERTLIAGLLDLDCAT